MNDMEAIRLETVEEKEALARLVHGYVIEPQLAIAKCLEQIEEVNMRFILGESNFGWTAFILSTYRLSDLHFRACDISKVIKDPESVVVEEDEAYLGELLSGYSSDDENDVIAVMSNTIIRFEELAESLKNGEVSWAAYLYETREIARLNYMAMEVVSTVKN